MDNYYYKQIIMILIFISIILTAIFSIMAASLVQLIND